MYLFYKKNYTKLLVDMRNDILGWYVEAILSLNLLAPSVKFLFRISLDGMYL